MYKFEIETDENTRIKLESEQEGLFNQREFGCMDIKQLLKK